MTSLVKAYVNQQAIAHNTRLLRELLAPSVQLCAVVKANAYGHGVGLVAPALAPHVDRFAVATVAEGVQLAELGLGPAIMVFGPIFACERSLELQRMLQLLLRYNLEPTVQSLEGAGMLNDAAKLAGVRVRCHVKVDTGMGRMGLPVAQVPAFLRQWKKFENLRLFGLYTHFAVASEPDGTDFTLHQLRQFSTLLQQLRQQGVHIPLVHAANSAALVQFKETHFDMVRPGLALLGYQPCPKLTLLQGLRPAMRVVSQIVFTKHLPAGHSVGYGRTCTIETPRRVGIVPIGYHDGYLRRFSNRAVMTVDGKPARVLGLVSMDQTVIDLTEIPSAHVGSEVVVVSDRPQDANSIENLAAIAGTIPYEVTSLLGNRVQRLPAVAEAASAERLQPLQTARRNH